VLAKACRVFRPFCRFFEPISLITWHEWRNDMPVGTVKWFNDTKGYGFITPDGETKDVFVHKTAVERAGFRTLKEGQRVRFEVTDQKGKAAADNLQEESAA
jgi:cold shock protein